MWYPLYVLNMLLNLCVMSQPLTVARDFMMSLQCEVGNGAIRACGLESVLVSQMWYI